MCVTWLIHMRAMAHVYVCHDSFICVPWLIHMCAMVHVYACSDSFICVPWLIHMHAITLFHACHDSFIDVPWVVHVRAMTPPHGQIHHTTHHTSMKESCHTHEWDYDMHQSRHIYEWDINESYHTCEWEMDASCHTHDLMHPRELATNAIYARQAWIRKKCVMSQPKNSYKWEMNASRHTYELMHPRELATNAMASIRKECVLSHKKNSSPHANSMQMRYRSERKQGLNGAGSRTDFRTTFHKLNSWIWFQERTYLQVLLRSYSK